MVEIGYTGTRQGMTIEQHAALCKIMLCYHKTEGAFRWHHGCCVGGDEQCHNLAKIFDFKVRGHPPINTALMANLDGFESTAPPEQYIPRNHKIVNETEILIATPHQVQEVQRSGTWATIRFAKKIGRRVVMIRPNGYAHSYE